MNTGNIRRIILYVLVAALAVLLVNAWMKDYPSKKTSTQTTSQKASGNYSPPTFNPGTAAQTKKTGAETAFKVKASTTPGGNVITVKTDVLTVGISRKGGNIVSLMLPKYPVSQKEKNNPVQILSGNPNQLYIAQSALTNTGPTVYFSSVKKNYVLQNGEKELVVQLKGRSKKGLMLTKTYTFTRGQYAFKLDYAVQNNSSRTWSGSLYTQITRRKPSKSHHSFYTRSYNGAAVSSPGTPYEKISYKSMDEANLSRTNKGGWVAMQQHYFLTAWIPGNADELYHYYTHVIKPKEGNRNIYIVGFVSPQMTAAPKAQASTTATIYVGPEIAKNLSQLAPGLDRTIDYGWLWPISIIIFWVMNAIYSFVGNWGWAIVITTILIKIVFYPLTAKSFRSMARMRELQPKMQALKERYADDRQAMSKATMELYRKEKINPLGGCLPMLIQIPVFIGLYYVLVESVQLRQAPFIFWIHDLSQKDPYYVLPILMGLSMLAQQWLSPTATDPTQQKMMWVLPIIFTIFFLHFPSGLVLYWFVNNLVQVLQQWYVNETFEKHKAKLKARKRKKKRFFK